MVEGDHNFEGRAKNELLELKALYRNNVAQVKQTPQYVAIRLKLVRFFGLDGADELIDEVLKST